MFILVGAIVVTVSVAGGFMLAGGHILALVQPPEFIVIGGAAIGNLLISTPPAVLKMLLGQCGSVMKGGTAKKQYLDLLAMQYQIFKLIQQAGVMALESHFEEPAKSPVLCKFPEFLKRHHAVDFLSDSVKVIIVGGIAPHDLEALMDEDLEVHHAQAITPSSTVMRIADALPGLGIVAAVLGIVITMASIDGPPNEIGEKVGAALVGTFFGILLSYGFAQPFAVKLEHMVNEDAHYLQCIKSGLLAVYKGFPPAIAVEFARRVIPGDVRPSFDETERVCKTQRADMAQAA
jgi:chemotaxis protein MotA